MSVSIRYPSPDKLELVARLPKPATIIMLAPDDNAIRSIGDLAGLRIGIGPSGSGTALFSRQVFGAKRFSQLKPQLLEHSFGEQLKRLKSGDLDLGVFILDENAPLVEQAVREGLQVVDFDNVEALAAQVPALRVAMLYAGYFDLVKRLPSADKKVFQLDHLILSNRKATRSEITALLVLLNSSFKGFVDYNRVTPNQTGLREATQLEDFIQNNGPSVLDQYAPRLIDFIPPANLLHYLVVISLLFNATTVWHNFGLWRIDAKRLKLEDRVLQLFGQDLTIAEIV